MYYRSTLTSKGQITIPKELRDKYNLKEGEQVMITASKDGLIVRPATNPLRELRGYMKEEVNLEKAEKFISTIRKQWRL